MRFSLFTLLLVVSFIAMALGWFADHVYLSRATAILRATERLRTAMGRAKESKTKSDYEVACREACEAIWALDDFGPRSKYAIAAYVDAINSPELYNIDYSPRSDASASLVRAGPDAIPVVVGLLHSEDRKVREVVMTSLISYLTHDSLDESAAPPSRSEAVVVLQGIRNRCDPKQIDDVLSELDYWLARLRPVQK